MAGTTGSRVVVDLSAYFLDYRQKSLIFIDRVGIKSVQQLINHICDVFCLVDDFEIFVLDAHVPRSECADIIQEGDIIRVEKVTNQTDLSGTSVDHKKRKKYHKEILLDDIILPSKKKKKRKIRKCETVGYGTVSEEHVPESTSSSLTCSSEPRKKKKKKSVNKSPGGSFEAYPDGQELEHDLKKGKKKKSVADPKEWSQCILSEKVACNESNYLENTDTAETEFSSKPERVQVSTPNAENNQLAKRELEHSLEKDMYLVDFISERNGETLLTNSSLLDKSTESCNVYSDTLCETHIGNDSGTSKKRHRQRKRKKPKREGHSKTLPGNIPKLPSSKPLNGLGVIVAKRKMELVNNKHIRFSDEELKEKVTEIPEVGEIKNLGSICGNSIVCEDSLDVKDSSTSLLEGNEEISIIETSEEKKDMFPKENNGKSVEYNGDKRICQGKGKNSSIDGFVINNDSKGCTENGVHFESVLEENGSHGNLPNCGNSATTLVSSKDPFSKPVDLPQSKGNRRKNVIIAMGLGVTLSQLLRESKKLNKEEFTPQKSNRSESIVPVSKAIKDVELDPTENQRSYGGFPVLEKFPQRGDILAFKVLKLNEKYEPTISGYLEGKIMDCDSTKSLVTVKVLVGAQELKKTTGKFDIIEEEDETTAVSDQKYNLPTLQLQWDEFIEPRLVFP